MADTFSEFPRHVDGPITRGFAVTPNDSTDLAVSTRGLYVGVSGDVKVDFVDSGDAITLVGLAAGVWHPLRVTRVYSTDTTATSIVGGA